MDAKSRRKWLDGGQVRVRTSSRPKSMRLEIDGAIISINFAPKGANKSSVAIEQEKLPSREAVDGVKTFWAERFVALGKHLRNSD